MKKTPSNAQVLNVQSDNYCLKICLKINSDLDRQFKAYSYRKVRLPECRSTPES
ncbi:MAG: hypothetical protein IJ571_04560 [Ruminococcus sp.]|nr:hypothetical protein [Ruminococcus sp.]